MKIKNTKNTVTISFENQLEKDFLSCLFNCSSVHDTAGQVGLKQDRFLSVKGLSDIHQSLLNVGGDDSNTVKVSQLLKKWY